jgi:hypothetical protein
VKVKAKKLNTLEQEIKQQLEDNIIRLRDTRGNFSMGIKIPNKDYSSKPDPSKERKRRYWREYYQRPYVIARRNTPEFKARKALYDRLRNRKK